MSTDTTANADVTVRIAEKLMGDGSTVYDVIATQGDNRITLAAGNESAARELAGSIYCATVNVTLDCRS